MVKISCKHRWSCKHFYHYLWIHSFNLSSSCSFIAVRSESHIYEKVCSWVACGVAACPTRAAERWSAEWTRCAPWTSCLISLCRECYLDIQTWCMYFKHHFCKTSTSVHALTRVIYQKHHHYHLLLSLTLLLLLPLLILSLYRFNYYDYNFPLCNVPITITRYCFWYILSIGFAGVICHSATGCSVHLRSADCYQHPCHKAIYHSNRTIYFMH